MTKSEFEKLLADTGIRAQAMTNDAKEKLSAYLDSYKAKLDTETRRKTRAVWAPIGFAVGSVAGYLFHALIG